MVTYDCMNDKFYNNVLEPQYDCDWQSVEDSQLPELTDILQGATIIKMEEITDGENICGVLLYLNKCGEKFVLKINAPDYMNESEKGVYFEFVSEKQNQFRTSKN